MSARSSFIVPPLAERLNQIAPAFSRGKAICLAPRIVGVDAARGGEGARARMGEMSPLRCSGRRGRGPARSAGRVRWALPKFWLSAVSGVKLWLVCYGAGRRGQGTGCRALLALRFGARHRREDTLFKDKSRVRAKPLHASP
jgi:hypothetical protein